MHGPLNGEPGEIYELISRVAPEVGLISISMNQREPKPDLNWIANCPNALDFSVYPVKPHRGEYLLFLGRMSPDKGAHRAVAVAMEAGLPLKLAGKMQEPKEREYFHELVEPHLVDGIEYLGEVTHGEKVELLQNARATLFPIEWEEPFGLVMIESMACGTPVIATRWGAVPEVIEHGRSGIIVDHYKQMADALPGSGRPRPVRATPLRRGGVLAGADGARLRRRLREGDRLTPGPGVRPAVPALGLEPRADALGVPPAKRLPGVANGEPIDVGEIGIVLDRDDPADQADVAVPAAVRRAPSAQRGDLGAGTAGGDGSRPCSAARGRLPSRTRWAPCAASRRDGVSR